MVSDGTANICSMPRHTLEKRQAAKRLRAGGWTLRQICNELGVALSTVSLWVRDVGRAGTTVSAAPSEPATETELEVVLRRCGRCGEDLPTANFNRHATGYQWWCRECFRAYFRARGEVHREQSREARRRRRREVRAFLDDYLRSHACAECGEADPIVLEFDHVGAKRGHVAVLAGGGISMRGIKRELVNCEVVCVNCHRVRSARAQQWWRSDPAAVNRRSSLTPAERRNIKYVWAVLSRSRCVDCGESRIEVLDFDHVGTKTGHVGEIARRGCSIRRLEAEISQCEVRCGNCHRRRTRRQHLAGRSRE